MDGRTKLSPWLADVRDIIASRSVGKQISCKENGSFLSITDSTVDEVHCVAQTIAPDQDGVGILLTTTIGQAVLKEDPTFPEFHVGMETLAMNWKMILMMQDALDPMSGNTYRKYGFAVRMPWHRNVTQLTGTLSHSLGNLRHFYSRNIADVVRFYQRCEITTISDAQFDKLIPIEPPSFA